MKLSQYHSETRTGDPCSTLTVPTSGILQSMPWAVRRTNAGRRFGVFSASLCQASSSSRSQPSTQAGGAASGDPAAPARPALLTSVSCNPDGREAPTPLVCPALEQATARTVETAPAAHRRDLRAPVVATSLVHRRIVEKSADDKS
jgi:hypothetical protein